MIDPTSTNINRLFFFSIKNDDNNLATNSFYKYYMSLVEIKDFNSLIDNKPVFDQLVKNKPEKLVEIYTKSDYNRQKL